MQSKIIHTIGPPRQISRISTFFFWSMEKLPQMSPNNARRICFLLIQTLPTFWAERICILRFLFLIFLELIFPDFQVPRSPNSQIFRSPDLQIPRSPNSQISPGLGVGVRCWLLKSINGNRSSRAQWIVKDSMHGQR